MYQPKTESILLLSEDKAGDCPGAKNVNWSESLNVFPETPREKLKVEQEQISQTGPHKTHIRLRLPGPTNSNS